MLLPTGSVAHSACDVQRVELSRTPKPSRGGFGGGGSYRDAPRGYGGRDSYPRRERRCASMSWARLHLCTGACVLFVACVCMLLNYDKDH